jgi:hypothetical protein
MRKSLIGVGAAFALLAVSGIAHASTVNVSIWENNSSLPIPADVPGTAADITGTMTSNIMLDSRLVGNGYTIGGFLGSGGATFTSLTGASQLGNTVDNTLWNITGSITVTNGESFTALHDDGLDFLINGTNLINASNPTAPATSTGTWTGLAGTYNFQLIYSEVQGPPAVLEMNVSGVPEPSTWAMMILGFFGVGFMAYRRKQNGLSFRVA